MTVAPDPRRTGPLSPDDTVARLAAAALAVVLVIITAAAFLRMSHAGLGCPDWPACYGYLEANAGRLQQAAPGVAVRVVHRIAALSAGALVLALGWHIASRRPRRAAEVAVFTALLALLVFLAIIGRWTGVSRIPAVAVGNILGGSALLALLWLVWRMQRPAPPVPRQPALAVLAWAALLAFALQASLGAVVSAKYAALSCGGWFSCPGAAAAHGWSAFDPFAELVISADGAVQRGSSLATLQLAHHCGAAAVLILALALGAALARFAAFRPVGIAVMACAAAQVVLGAAAVLYGHPLTASIAHNVMANLLLLALVSAAHDL
ncbi:MAG TPA: COX15/CtaA family protein, partial [Burkholderiales bacterium]|nr:COX15/CtaA family protein [Burkholderiales bacterium]